jgi:ABC-type phosphate/phosphonate transport system permease subunit
MAWLKELLIDAINGNLTNLFADVNSKTSTIAVQVGQTPSAWNADIYQMIRALSETVIVPVAGVIIAYVLCYELITMVTEKNNLHDIDTWMFFKWVFKAFVAVYLVTHCFDIAMAIFDLGQYIVSAAAGFVGGSTSIDITAALASLTPTLEAMEVPELLLLVIETLLVSLCMKIMAVIITVILYGRMIEIYLMCSVAPVPFATLTNREWGQMGTGYLRALLALAFQGFLLMVCVGIYAVLVRSVPSISTGNLHIWIFSVAAYTAILCIAMIKSGALSKTIFNSH